PDISVKLTPRGGKPILERLARDILERDIEDTLVAMDSDYDDFRGRKIDDRRVLYSHGYSWENEVYASGNLERVYCTLCHCGIAPQEVRDQFEIDLAELDVTLKRATHADFYALCSGSSVLPRRAPGRVIASDPVSGKPSIVRTELIKLVGEARSKIKKPMTPHTGPPKDALRFCVGHVFAFAIRILIKAVASIHYGRLSVPPDHLRDVALLTFSDFLRSDAPHAVVQHHRAQSALI
ncbi:MAG TPA: hypothetical protein VF655_13805, partial [Allosphingosinicella sp.]